MGILNRLIRIFKADIHGVMDQFEDKGLLLKQYLRDMQEALSEKETCLKQVTVARTQAQQDDENFGLEIEKWEHDLTIALKKDRDDIARLLIKKIIPLKKIHKRIREHIDTLDREITVMRDGIDQQRIQYEDLMHRSRQYFHKADQNAWEKAGTIFNPGNVSDDLSNEEIELELLQRKEALFSSQEEAFSSQEEAFSSQEEAFSSI
jgi:phage shock protein A